MAIVRNRNRQGYGGGYGQSPGLVRAQSQANMQVMVIVKVMVMVMVMVTVMVMVMVQVQSQANMQVLLSIAMVASTGPNHSMCNVFGLFTQSTSCITTINFYSYFLSLAMPLMMLPDFSTTKVWTTW